MPPTAEIQPGDLILVTKGGGDPLAEFVCELDGSEWSHCGIAVSDTEIANCRSGLAVWDRHDDGGVRLDPIDLFVQAGRDVYRARPTLDTATLGDAVQFASAFGLDGVPGAQQSGFGYAKLFVVSCGLSGVNARTVINEKARRAILAAAVEAARSASWTAARADFFCSEFVAAAYAQSFREDDLTPPVVIDVEGTHPLGLPERIERFFDRITTELENADALADLARLALTMIRYDMGYLIEAFATTVEWKRFEEEHPKPPPSGPAPTPPDPDTVPPARRKPQPLWALPQALVTPRMLARACWMERPELIARGKHSG